MATIYATVTAFENKLPTIYQKRLYEYYWQLIKFSFELICIDELLNKKYKISMDIGDNKDDFSRFISVLEKYCPDISMDKIKKIANKGKIMGDYHSYESIYGEIKEIAEEIQRCLR